MKQQYLVLLFLFLTGSIHAQTHWTVPVPLNPASGQQGIPSIAISHSGLIAIACGEADGIVMYRSADRGVTFSRFILPLPAAPEYQLRGVRGVAFDQQGNLFVLWRWDETNGPFTIAEYLVLSKSADSGASYSTFWQKRQQQDLGQVAHLLQIDSQNTIHVVWDSTTSRPEIFRLRYTRFMNGDPSNRVDHVLPRLVDTVTEVSASMSIVGDTLNYAVGFNQRGAPFYARSVDGGASFSPYVAIDTVDATKPVLVQSRQGGAILYARYINDRSPYNLCFFKLISGLVFPNTPNVRLGTTAMDLSAPKNLVSFGEKHYVVYQGFDLQHVICYYEYDSLQDPPTDSTFFTTMSWPIFVRDSSGGKILLGIHRTEYRVYISRKDIISSVYEKNRPPGRAPVSMSAIPNRSRRLVRVSVRLEKDAEGSIKVFDILGRQLWDIYGGKLNQGINEFDVSTDNLPSGVYFAFLRSSVGSVAAKFLITQ